MFRFRLAPTGTPMGSSSGANAPLKWMAVFAVALLTLGILAGWMLGRHQDSATESYRDTGAIIVQMQKLGQLHTASFKESDVLHQDTEAEPNKLVKIVPGGSEIYHWATHNQALVTAEGTVEAGMDLSRITDKDVEQVKQPDGTIRLRVHLPPITIYPPNVHVHVERSQSGPFWHDENIVPKAQETAGRLFTEAAEKADIRGKARANALETLQQTFKTLGVKNIDFTF